VYRKSVLLLRRKGQLIEICNKINAQDEPQKRKRKLDNRGSFVLLLTLTFKLLCTKMRGDQSALQELALQKTFRRGKKTLFKTWNVKNRALQTHLKIPLFVNFMYIHYMLLLRFSIEIIFKLPPYTLMGFDLTTHSSSLLGGRQRRYR
jgi:hypothetical protein